MTRAAVQSSSLCLHLSSFQDPEDGLGRGGRGGNGSHLINLQSSVLELPGRTHSNSAISETPLFSSWTPGAPPTSTHLNCGMSLQSSTLGRRVLHASLVCATFSGHSLAMMALSSNMMVFSAWKISCSVCGDQETVTHPSEFSHLLFLGKAGS